MLGVALGLGVGTPVMYVGLNVGDADGARLAVGLLVVGKNVLGAWDVGSVVGQSVGSLEGFAEKEGQGVGAATMYVGIRVGILVG